MNYNDYREKLGIGFNDEQKFQALKNKSTAFTFYLCNNLKPVDYRNDSFIDYFLGVCESPNTTSLFTVMQSFDGAKTFSELLFKLTVFVNTIEKHISNKTVIEIVREFIPNSLDDLGIRYECLTDCNGKFFFQKGAKELDDALVSEPLEWLKEYPNARKEWIEALKAYSNVDKTSASDVADKFRKSLERFFQEFFVCNKSLENMISIYGDYLTSKGVPKEISNNFSKLLKSYTDFNNNYAKHKDGTQLNTLEYIMYQTGNIIRLIITLNRE